MRVPFLQVGAAYQELKAEIDRAYHRLMESGWYLFGEELEGFEREFASYCEAPFCVGVGNGLDALVLLLKAHGVGPDDEVIVPANTYIATWLAVTLAGATPAPVEPDPATFNLDPALVEAAITRKTKVIMPVHLYGMPADVDPILETAGRQGLAVIEDAAQAHGARYKGRRVGGLSGSTAFSFYPTKNLGAFGDGGAVVTRDSEIARQVRVLGNYGSREKYHNEVKGHNSRLDSLQAAFLRAKLPALDEWNRRRRRIAERYLRDLEGVEGLVLPAEPSWAESAWHLFVIQHPERDRLQAHLSSQGIGTLIHYPVPPHLSQAYADMGWKEGAFPVTEQIARTALSLPLNPHLTAEDVDLVVDAVRSFCR